jgi:hypothetical protein
VEQTTQNPPANSATPPLVGAKEFGPGSAGSETSYLIPSFQYTAFVDTNPEYSANKGTRLFQSSYLGSLTLQDVTRNKQFNLKYAGGAEFYHGLLNSDATNSRGSYETFHQVSIGESVDWQRWHLLVDDEASYLPESSRGFSGFEGLGSFNSGLGGEVLWSGGNLNNLLQPDQSILGSFARRVSSTVIGQIQYDATPRTAFTMTGAYGLLSFLDPGFTDVDYISSLASVTHALGPRNYISGTYLRTFIRFHVPHEDISGQGFMLSYGHRIWGRLSFEVSAGYMLNHLAIAAGGARSLGFMTAYDSLHYRWRKTDFNAYFNRWTTGGSGILPGAETNSLGGNVSRQLFRTSRLDMHLGYYSNRALTQAAPGTIHAKSEAWEGGIQLSRELGRHLSVFIEYNVQRQVANDSLCVANRCGVTFLRHMGGVGLNWHPRPIRLQ